MISSSQTSLFKKYSQVFPVGLKKKIYPATLAKRRKKLLGYLDSLTLFAAVPREPGAENVWIMSALKIFQEPSFLYLTGINQPGLQLLLNPFEKEGAREILFLPKKNPRKEFWDGVRFGCAENEEDGKDIQFLTGIQIVLPSESLIEYLRQWFGASTIAHGHLFYHDYKDPKNEKKRGVHTDHNYSFLRSLNKKSIKNIRGKKIEWKSCAEIHFKRRLPLDDYQIANVKKAASCTRRAFLETLGRWSSFQTEHELANFMDFSLQKRSPFGLSFPTIVAGGVNASILHYLKNDEPLKRGTLVLMDFGVRFGSLHADISRTLPVSGRFNPMQNLLYQIVLEALMRTEKAATPAMTIRRLNGNCWDFIEQSLKKRFLSKGGFMERPYDVQPHGVSHLMGEQEHDGDPFKLYQDSALEPGWQISNEPGLYGFFAWKKSGVRYRERLGIRIEDNLLIRTQAALNLSRTLFRKIEDLEALLSRGN